MDKQTETIVSWDQIKNSVFYEFITFLIYKNYKTKKVKSVLNMSPQKLFPLSFRAVEKISVFPLLLW